MFLVNNRTRKSTGVTESFLSTVYPEEELSYPEELGRPICEASAADGYNDYRFWKSRTGLGSVVENYLISSERKRITANQVAMA